MTRMAVNIHLLPPLNVEVQDSSQATGILTVFKRSRWESWENSGVEAPNEVLGLGRRDGDVGFVV